MPVRFRRRRRGEHKKTYIALRAAGAEGGKHITVVVE